MVPPYHQFLLVGYPAMNQWSHGGVWIGHSRRDMPVDKKQTQDPTTKPKRSTDSDAGAAGEPEPKGPTSDRYKAETAHEKPDSDPHKDRE